MDIIDYLKKVSNDSLSDKSFNECDSLILSVISYFPFHKLNNPKNSYDVEELYERLNQYRETSDSKRKQELLLLLKIFCRSERYKKAKFIHYKNSFDKDSYKQFRAVSVALNDFIFLSFSGTDASKEGWIEDFNMSCMDIVPAEEEAEKYVKEVLLFHPFKKVYFGGHSKGGRLAIRAAKSMKKPNKIISVYSFDGPNFKDNFYDEKFNIIKDKIHYYAPYESVFGRLINNVHEPEIISSNEKFILQHSYLSWEIKGDEFIRLTGFSKRSTLFVTTVNDIIDKYDDNQKKIIVNAITDILNKLEIEYFTGPEMLVASIKKIIPMIPAFIKSTPKKESFMVIKAITKIITSLAANYLVGQR